MDRPIVYSSEVPRSVDHLNGWKMAMVGAGRFMLDMLGTGTLVGGLPCTQTSVASLGVLVGPGAIYAVEPIDATAYSVIPADTANTIIKQGLLLAPGVTLATPSPIATGQSINYLVQAEYQDSDTSPVVLAYFNSANPFSPYSGPNNNGSSQPTVRSGVCTVQIKAGAAAATGSQTTPTPDAGFVALYVVTVSFGQTTVTSANISIYPAAPFLVSNQLADRLIGIRVFTASGTYTPTKGMTTYIAYAQGGGAGGGACPATGASQGSVASGGGGGSYGIRKGVASDIGASLPVTIGAGGNGGAAGANGGGAGGTSSLGTLISCPGGSGGFAGTVLSSVGSTTNYGAGGSPPSGANVSSTPGINGGLGLYLVQSVFSGPGGGSPASGGAGGGPIVGGGTAGSAGTSVGAGGSGSAVGASGSARAGGAGVSGQIIIWEYA